MDKVLILSAPYGSGHKYCAKSLQEKFENENCFVENLDYYENFCNTNLVNISKEIHSKSFTWWGKKGYKIGFWASNRFFMPEISSKSAIGRKKFEDYLIKNNFNKVIITFPIASIYSLCKKHKKIDFYEVVTDYSLHKKWQNPNLRAIFVGSHELKSMYPNLSNLIVSGIPVVKRNIEEKKIKVFNNPNKKVISIILGANGSINSKLSFIDKIDSNYHINIICGKNKILHKQLILKYENTKHINVWGFITDVQNLYSASDLVITKSGGMTCAELITYKTKALFFEPQYGQELDNANFLTKNNIAKIIDTRNSINRQINYMLSLNPDFESLIIKNSHEIIVKKVLENENK